MILSSNIPPLRKSEIEYYSMLAKCTVHPFGGSNVSLGSACGRLYRVSCLSIEHPGDSDILVALGHESVAPVAAPLPGQSAVAEDLSFVAGEIPAGPTRIEARIRYRSEPAPAALTVREDGRAEVRFQRPQRAVTPGQAVVFYQGQRVLGGGTIVRV